MHYMKKNDKQVIRSEVGNSNLRFAGCPLPKTKYAPFNHTLFYHENGFTFIEMIIVVGMLCVISLAIYATFNNGIKIWQKINQSILEEDLYILFDKFTVDLKNSCKFTGIEFLGNENRVEFATLVDSSKLGKRTIGKVIYFFDRHGETIGREQRDFSQIYNGEEGTITRSLKSIKSLRFQYYVFDLDKQQYLWLEEWLKEDLPLAVRMELELDNGNQINKFTKTVSIPVSS